MNYQVTVLKYEEIHELPGGWLQNDYSEILNTLDFDDVQSVDPLEYKEYTVMSLQDLKTDEAAEVVLRYKLGDQLRPGQIENLSHEMMEEKLWEEYTDIFLHKELYNCTVLLKAAFPNKFPETNAAMCKLALECGKSQSKMAVDKASLVRLLADGMDDHAIVKRLFAEQLKKGPFPEAEGIIWAFDSENRENQEILTIFSSEYWLHDLESASSYTSQILHH